MDRDKGKGLGSNLWSTLLSDASAATTKSLFTSDKSIIVLGNDLTGKSALVSKLQGKEELHRGSALDFEVIDVEDEDIDESGVCRLWVVDGHLAYRSLLQFALPQPMLTNTLVLITVDMSQPWNIPDSLEKWSKLLHEHMNSLKISSNQLSNFKQKLIDDFLNYVDPSDLNGEEKIALAKNNDENLKINSENLGSIALSESFGIPIIVICTKCDLMESLESEYDYIEEHFDYIQHYLRLKCLKLGAALVYTSLKETKNIEVLKKYILHKLYGFPFNVSASVVDRDALFVPLGWDSEKKLSLIKDGLTKFSVSDPYSSIISRPASTRIFSLEGKEQVAEDEQVFLSRAQAVLNKAPTLSKTVGSEASSIHSKIRTSQDSSITFGSKGKLDPSKAGDNNERMLANFFNSLLNKKPGSPSVKSARKSSDHQQQSSKTSDS